PISNQLLKIANKTLIYEINKKRIEQNLHGSTKEERYQYFVKTYFENYQNLYSLLSNYPVLGRLISETTEFLYKAIFGELDDWSTDREAIQHQFLGEIQLITGITIMGDVHNSGKSVLKFTFNEN
ncbi:DUF4135 domain-containing protein, partial [Pantoea sp. SIMBA_079]|uniref:DUF4135 domain-containing protein n=1 Tax=Pantoea sp. SIMBA_079 TaxID=3085817 RepID=UPI0039934C5B